MSMLKAKDIMPGISGSGSGSASRGGSRKKSAGTRARTARTRKAKAPKAPKAKKPRTSRKSASPAQLEARRKFAARAKSGEFKRKKRK